jgi:hypothetical protein
VARDGGIGERLPGQVAQHRVGAGGERVLEAEVERVPVVDEVAGVRSLDQSANSPGSVPDAIAPSCWNSNSGMFEYGRRNTNRYSRSPKGSSVGPPGHVERRELGRWRQDRTSIVRECAFDECGDQLIARGLVVHG